jgi:hypothetical protein
MLSWAESFNIVQAADETYHDLEFLCNQEEQVVIFFITQQVQELTTFLLGSY